MPCRPFADLVDELVADCRRAPTVGELELEALGFAMAFESAVAEQEAEAPAVADALAAHERPARGGRPAARSRSTPAGRCARPRRAPRGT